MWKIGLALILLVVTFGGGYYYGNKNVQTIEKIVIKQGEVKTVTQEKIITRTIIKKPDGTTEEVVREEVRDVNREERTAESDTGTTRIPGGTGGNYRLGVQYGLRSIADAYRPDDWRSNVSVYASRRIVGPVWIDVGGRPYGDRKEVTLGLAITW